MLSRVTALFIALTLSTAVLGCGGGDASPDSGVDHGMLDQSTPVDAGGDAGSDGGPDDSDGGVDQGPPDAGAMFCSGTSTCGGLQEQGCMEAPGCTWNTSFCTGTALFRCEGIGNTPQCTRWGCSWTGDSVCMNGGGACNPDEYCCGTSCRANGQLCLMAE